MPDRYADTKVDADGRRVPASEFKDDEGPARSTKVDPSTRIAADGTRKPMDEIDDNEVAPVGRTAEARAAEEPTEPEPTAEPTEPEQPESEPEPEADEPEAEDPDDDDEDLEDLKVVELKERAKDAGIEGYSSMKKDELVKALEDHED